MPPDDPPCQIYLISPPRLAPGAFRPLLAEVLESAPVAAFQLRLPGAEPRALAAAIDALREEVQGRNIAFMLAELPDLARETGCDGVHLEDPETRIKPLRARLGDGIAIGVSCGASRHAAMQAGEAGADYVSFGPCWASPTKARAARPQARDTLAWWARMMQTPCVAVGGIDAGRAAEAAALGAEFVAVLSAVWDHPAGPAAGLKAIDAALRDARGGPA